jgi:hypothetical protein
VVHIWQSPLRFIFEQRRWLWVATRCVNCPDAPLVCEASQPKLLLRQLG